MNDPLIGCSINNFRIERLLGRGGMARVYYGWDVHLERPVAIKVIDPVEQPNPAYARRLVQEARAIARWRHEHIVQVYYADLSDNLYYFAMEYIEGRDLGALLAEYARENALVSHEDVLRIGWAVARALDYAHAQGVIHRDVKPSNVMIANDGRIVLTDFGLALDVGQGTLGEAFGTPHYMAPEQAVSSSGAVPQSDLYSLGVILYEMLTGRVPFDDPSPISLAVHHISDPVPLPSTLNPAIGIGTEAVLMKALSKEPEERFPSGEALMSALEQSLAEAPTCALPAEETTREFSPVSIAERVTEHHAAAYDEPPPTLTARMPPPPPVEAPAKRRIAPILALGGLGALACLLVVIGSVVWRGRLTDPANEPVSGIALVTSTLPVIERGPVTRLAGTAAAPTPDATPAPPSILPSTQPSGYRVVLLYTETGLYFWNPGEKDLSIRPIRFEALDAAGEPTRYRFGGNQWAEYYPSVMPGYCNALEVAEHPYTNRPPECANYNATRTPPSNSDLTFWIPREGITQFRVLWDDQEIARCEIAAGLCEMYLPE